MHRIRRTLAGTTLLALAACHRAPAALAPTPTPAPAPAAPAATPASSPAMDEAARQRLHADSVRRQVLAAADSARLASDRAALADRIHFDFDRWDLTPDDIQRLEVKRQEMAAHPELKVRIAGNCDERGPDEYNLALGLRRASEAKRWLVAHGIDDGRISIISYGEESPVDSGHDEQAWAANRRDDFAVTGKNP
jgi:peptidoglycan-associated lipoprotein